MADKKISALTASTTPLAGTEVLPIVQGGTTVKVSAANLTAGRAVNVLSLTSTGGGGAIVQLVDNTVLLKNSSAIASGILSFQRADGTQKAAVASYYNVADEGDLEFIGPTGSTNARLSSAGNFSITNGNVVISTSGKGIDFSATPGTGTSELLADYEEGIWSPVGVNFTTVGTETFAGFYVKVGTLVFINATFKAATSTASTANSTYFTGLPFTPATSSTVTAVGNSSITSYGVGLIDTSVRIYTPTWTSGANQSISVAGVYRVA